MHLPSWPVRDTRRPVRNARRSVRSGPRPVRSGGCGRPSRRGGDQPGPRGAVVARTVVGGTVEGGTVEGGTVEGGTVVGSTVVGMTVVGSACVRRAVSVQRDSRTQRQVIADLRLSQVSGGHERLGLAP